ncbi:MAG: metal-dependent hydrolase [Candidatus Nanohaloarchaea archaeon]|nr:metal-dependent hydrolase [Candidatus Nanohaloarchaea archaeon]
MYPRQHAAISAVAVTIAGALLELSLPELAFWGFVGVLSGVLVDIDHLPLAVFFNRKSEEVRDWLRHPLKALTHARELREDIDPEENLVAHRMVSHLLGFGVLCVLAPYHRLVIPAVIAVGVHIISDVAWDIREQDGNPYI